LFCLPSNEKFLSADEFTEWWSLVVSH
jgi:hypothetical protein